MASSRSEESDGVNTHTNRQKRGLSFTGMLRDSLSLLVPTFVLDATTPKRRRVQEEPPANTLSEDKSNQTQQSCQPFNFSSNLQTCTSTPTGTDTSNNRQTIQQSITPLYPSLASFREGGLEERVSTPDIPFNRHQHPAVSLSQRTNDTQIYTHNLPQEPSHLNSAKRTRLNDSHIPTSSFSALTHTSGSSSSGSMLGETYHQSPFYPGKTTYGGASNYRREALRGRLNVGKRTQTTVVPLRLNSVISQNSPVVDDLSDVASTSSESGPILSAATRRILRAMRRGTDSTQDIAARDTFGTTARSMKNQRHSLWTSCVRRRGVNAHKSNAPPTVELRRFPPSSHEANNIFSSSSWPRDAIGVPPVNSGTGSQKQDRLRAEIKGTTTDFDKQLQRAVGVLTSSYSFSSPAIRSQPSTRPPSNASSDVSRSNFIFQSPPSRSASSNALADLVSFTNPNTSSGITNLINENACSSESTATGRHDTVKKTDLTSSCFQSKIPFDSQSSPAPFLFSGSRTLPELRPSFDSLPVSKSYPNKISSTSFKRALPQESWRCEACLAENAFLVTSCRVCQRVPSNTVSASQRKWYSESTEPFSQTNKNHIILQRKKNSDDELSATDMEKSKVTENVNVYKTDAPSTTNSVNLEKWRCETCLVENPETSESCVCCQSSKPKPMTNTLMHSDVATKWRCETCLVENPETSESCVCCQSSKSKPKTSKVTSTNATTKWRCETCLVENPETSESCVCCQSSKPKPKAGKPTLSNTTVKWQCETCLVENLPSEEKCVSCSSNKVKSKEDSAYSSSQGKTSNKWRCDTCLVENDGSKTKCVCCENLKPMPELRSSDKLSMSSSNETWRCDTCLVENKISSTKCVCCENPKTKVNDNSSKGTSGVIASGGLLSSWKSSGETKFGFGTMACDNTPTDNENHSKSSIKFGFDNHQKMNNNGSIEIPGNVFKFGSKNLDTTSSGYADKTSSSSGNSNVSGCLSQGKLTEKSNPITNIKFGVCTGGKSTEDVSKTAPLPGFVFGKDKIGGFQMDGNSGNRTFVFGNAKPEPMIGNIKPSNDIGQSNSTEPNVDGKVVSSKRTHFAFGIKDDVKTTDPLPTESNSDKENPDKIAFNQSKSHFGGFKVTGGSTDILSPSQLRLSTSVGNNPKSLFEAPAVACAPNVTPKEELKTSSNVMTSSAEKTNIPSNTQTSLFGPTNNTGKTSIFGTTPTVPPSTSIESLFSNSGPKMSFKPASDIPQFGTQSTAIKFRTPEGSHVENSKQKKLTSSISSPTLMSLPVTSSNNTVPPFSFGKSVTMNIDTPAFTDNSVFGAGGNKAQNNTFIFGGSNSEKLSTFPTQPMRETGSALSNPPVSTFTGVNKSSAAGFLANGPSSNNASNMFPTGQLSFGSNTGSQQPFVFGSSALGGSSAPNVSAQPPAPPPAVPCSFQFGNQTPSQQTPFLFGNNSNPTTNSAGTTNSSFGAPAANPFSSQGSVTASNPNRPIKKAHRRLRK